MRVAMRVALAVVVAVRMVSVLKRRWIDRVAGHPRIHQAQSGRARRGRIERAAGAASGRRAGLAELNQCRRGVGLARIDLDDVAANALRVLPPRLVRIPPPRRVHRPRA